MANTGSDAAWYETRPAQPISRGMRCTSCYLTMRDGVRIAINVYLPADLASGTLLPTILHQTRYHRAMELRWALRMLNGGRPFHHIRATARSRKRFIANGYAWVDVDVRGSGASYGHRISEWSPDEIRDGAEVVDWIVRQPWSSGKVGALGTSYAGATAEFLLVNQHPAVLACAPRFAVFDAYSDIAFPGGIHGEWFTRTWGRYNAALDRNAPNEVAGWWVKLLVTGVQPVQADHDRSLRNAAIAAHCDNYEVHEQALSLTFRDDVAPSDADHHESGSISAFSPHSYWPETQASGTPVYSYSGWFDGAYAHSAIKRFLTLSTPGCRLIIGPWNHGGRWHIDPLAAPTESTFDHDAELLRFFDQHLIGSDTGINAEPRVRYFTMVEHRWKTADTWPPPATMVRYHVLADRELGLDPPGSSSGADTYPVDHTTGTGEHSRWHTQVAIGEAVRYPDRATQDAKLQTYTSAALDHPLEVTGHPVVTLFVSSTARDGTFFVYLEDLDTDGRIAYVTEGQLRALHRRVSAGTPPYRQVVPYRTFARADAQPLVPGEISELRFDLLPTSYLFQAGHRIRIAIAGVDASHFAILPGGPPTVRIHRSSAHPSHIDLPVVGTA